MAYCRFGDSDIYLFHDCGGYIRCCGCCLVGDFFSGNKDPTFSTRTDAIDHICDHLKNDDYVASEVVGYLEEEIERLGNFVYNDDPPRKGELCVLEKELIKGDITDEK